jgi:predicted nuclease with RNAse H fold
MNPVENKAISTYHLHENKQILDRSLTLSPPLIAIDPFFSLLMKDRMRSVNKEGHNHGCPVLSPLLPAMERLT